VSIAVVKHHCGANKLLICSIKEDEDMMREVLRMANAPLNAEISCVNCDPLPHKHGRGLVCVCVCV
jgi:hypothetical protein